MLGLTQVQEVKLWQFAFLCICRLTLAWISSEISTKLLGMPTHLDRSSLTSARPYLIRLVSLLSDVDWPLASPFANCFPWVPLPKSYSRSLPISGHVEISSPNPFTWFRAKTDKGIVCLADHLHSVTFSQEVLIQILQLLYKYGVYRWGKQYSNKSHGIQTLRLNRFTILVSKHWERLVVVGALFMVFEKSST